MAELPAFRGRVLAQFLGDASFAVDWASDDERNQMWWYDDLHCPNPISPLWFDVGGWWHTCDYLFRRFGFPLATDWRAKNVNGYVYSAVVPAEPAYSGEIGAYFGAVMPIYASSFLDWWRNDLRLEIERNFAVLDGYDDAAATLPELMIHLENALDIQERHWRIHWILNLAQFQASLDLQAAIKVTIGEVDGELLGKVLVSDDDRNWDSIRALWELKNQVRRDRALRAAFEADTAGAILRRLAAAGPSGTAFLAAIDDYGREYGNRSLYAHEYIYPLWRENHAPIVETINSYVDSDYDFPAALEKVRKVRDAALADLRGRVPAGADASAFEAALDRALKMAPLTPDHHFYIDQGTYARLRLVFLAVGRKLAALGRIGGAEDVFYLRYHEIRVASANSDALDARAIVSERRTARDLAFRVRPREWVGTVTEWDLYTEPYKSLWGYPEKFHRSQAPPKAGDTIEGLPASAGIAEGIARVVASPAEFDLVRPGEILVCKMTSPSWIVVFTKIRGLVTDAGGALSHPAVVSREFGIPAVVGTTLGTHMIRTGDRVRVNGSLGTVEVLR
ncbi:MAG: PEP-utilizing protein mobile subunit [Chloroflexota bacterium]|nr:MAG: PEP-utilizing protein mobile subunit [Chloroflexota bacterium]